MVVTRARRGLHVMMAKCLLRFFGSGLGSLFKTV